MSAIKAVADPSAGPLGAEVSPELAEFSAALAAKHPGQFVQRFVFPKAIRQAREAFIREIDARDEIAAAAMADATMSEAQKKSQSMTADAERIELLRIALVGFGRVQPDGSMRYEHVDTRGAVPFTEINEWPSKAMTCLHAYFGEVNGVSTEELRNGIREAHPVGTFAAPPKPTSATLASEGSAR